MDRNTSSGVDFAEDWLSLSARRAWIEMRLADMSAAWNRLSLSARRAWIEIRGGYITKIDKDRRSPQGERG